jgi:hypothetical protein
MRTYLLRGAALLALALVGCGGGTPDVQPDVPQDNDTRLGEKIDIDLAAWLAKPRPELARLADEWTETIHKQTESARVNIDSVELLPKLTPPLVVPVFAGAAWSEPAGLSLPPYLKPGDRDGAVALHLARYGDHEAALKLADLGDRTLRTRLDALRGKRNYPLEWSRLVGLVLHSAELRVATGNVDGATQLTLLHEQLTGLLDARAKEGPLGAALLSAGRHALAQAAVAWADPKVNKHALAADVEKVIQGWGKVPRPVLSLPAGASAAEVAAVFGRPVKGPFVVHEPAGVARVLDLLGLPVPPAGAVAAAGFLDGKGGLAEVQVAYRSRIAPTYPTPSHMNYRLAEVGFERKDGSASAVILREVLGAGPVRVVTDRLTRGRSLGALVRVQPAGKSGAATAPRTLGAIDLDRTFETNRLTVAPHEAGPELALTDQATLQGLVRALGTSEPTSAHLTRDADHDLVGSVILHWPAVVNPEAATLLLPALWARLGSAPLSEHEDNAGYLSFTWSDGKTQARLQLPYAETSPTLIVEDARGAGALAERAAAARRGDVDARTGRLKAGNPEVRLPRSPGVVNGVSLEGLALGASRAEVEEALVELRTLRKQAIPGGLSLVLGEPPPEAPWWARQVFVRFAGERLAELRIRYALGPAKLGPKARTLLATLSAGKAGRPEAVPAEWDGLWGNLSGKKAVKLRWQDDRTVRTYQGDEGGIEVTWLDRPADQPAGVPLAPLDGVQHGPVAGVVPGAGRAEVVKALGQPVRKSTPEVFRAPAGPYESISVWFVDGKAARIAAVHRVRPSRPEAVPEALAKAWARDVATLGYPRRFEGKRGSVLQSYFWHDDTIRVQLYALSTGDGPVVFTEWRRWPLAAKQAVARQP